MRQLIRTTTVKLFGLLPIFVFDEWEEVERRNMTTEDKIQEPINKENPVKTETPAEAKSEAEKTTIVTPPAKPDSLLREDFPKPVNKLEEALQ